MKPEEQPEIGYYTRSLDGHRQSYLDFVKTIFGGNRVEGISLILRKHPVLFLMIEDNFLLYFIVGCIRAFLGRRTVGLLFRPKPALEASNFRLKLKLVMLRFLKKINSIQTLSIVPTTLEPKIATIVDDWIYDFQLWDITEEHKNISKKIRKGETNFSDLEKYEIAFHVKDKAYGRKILIALGAQNKGKGTHTLSENINFLNELGFLTIIAGRFDHESIQQKKNLENNGAIIFDRFMSDEEILALYSIADAVWCYYDPSYDQASGILGRSIQLGILPIVRPISFSEKFCNIAKIKYIAPNFKSNELLEFESLSDCKSSGELVDLSNRLGTESKIKIKQALGFIGRNCD